MIGNMPTKDVAATLKARLAELDVERDRIRSLLEVYEGKATDVEIALPPTPIYPDNRPWLRRGNGKPRFGPDPGSMTSRIVEAAWEILNRAPGQVADFRDVYDELPTDVRPKSKHAVEFARTAIKRAGGRRGLVYEDGRVKITKSPQPFG
jgi:hypothetical protein